MSDDQPPPAGWYPDPSGQQRYWNGTEWTEQYRPDPKQVVVAKKATTPAAWIGLGVVLVVALGLCMMSGNDSDRPSPTFSPPSSPLAEGQAPGTTTATGREEKQLQKFEGQTNHTTRPFTVPDKWEVRWNFSGTGHHSIVTYHGDGEYGDLLLSESGKPTTGSKFFPKGGEFYLEISGDEPWTVEVWQVP